MHACMHTVHHSFICKIEKKHFRLWIGSFQMQLYMHATENMFFNFFLFLISGLSFQIVAALYKYGSFLTIKAEYVLCGYILPKRFHTQI